MQGWRQTNVLMISHKYTPVAQWTQWSFISLKSIQQYTTTLDKNGRHYVLLTLLKMYVILKQGQGQQCHSRITLSRPGVEPTVAAFIGSAWKCANFWVWAPAPLIVLILFLYLEHMHTLDLNHANVISDKSAHQKISWISCLFSTTVLQLVLSAERQT